MRRSYSAARGLNCKQGTKMGPEPGPFYPSLRYENPAETAEFGFALTAKNRKKRMGLASLGSRKLAGDAQTRAAGIPPECPT